MTLVQFPAHRRIAEVRRCAETLLGLHGEAANAFWRSEISALAAALREQNVCEAEISRQAGLYMQAVQLEMQAAYAMESGTGQ
jgi:hypothetical protein